MDEDYPKKLLELERRFCSEEACVEYLAALRWPGGWFCPRCAGADAWVIRRTRWLCGRCRYEMSVTAGTIFQDSHVPLTIWFRAMWQITSQKNGMSALVYSVFSALAAIRRPGRCCINCAAPWFDPAATGWMALSRWTRPTGEERKPAQSAGGRRKRHCLSSPPKRMERASDAFVCVRYRMRPARACTVLFERRLRREARSGPTAGEAIWGWKDTFMTARCRAIKKTESICYRASIV